jgi:FkbM family methyltransferase
MLSFGRMMLIVACRGLGRTLHPMRRIAERIRKHGLAGLARRGLARPKDACRAVFGSTEAADTFLGRIGGLIHVGANVGQERDIYASFGLSVLWIEPISDVFDQLEKNIADFPKQRALRGLISDEDGKEYDFHIANNGGASSSILEARLHRDIWPDVTFDVTVRLRSVTLDALVDRGEIEPAKFQALVLDTQGSELLVLRGARRLLRGLQFVKVEAADFESYAGCAKVDDLISHLCPHGFVLRHRVAFATHSHGGCYYDLLFSRA